MSVKAYIVRVRLRGIHSNTNSTFRVDPSNQPHYLVAASSFGPANRLIGKIGTASSPIPALPRSGMWKRIRHCTGAAPREATDKVEGAGFPYLRVRRPADSHAKHTAWCRPQNLRGEMAGDALQARPCRDVRGGIAFPSCAAQGLRCLRGTGRRVRHCGRKLCPTSNQPLRVRGASAPAQLSLPKSGLRPLQRPGASPLGGHRHPTNSTNRPSC